MIRIALCDDNAIYLDVLKHKLHICLSEMNVAHTIKSVTKCEDLSKLLHESPIDLVFLDIMMYGKNIVEWAGTHVPLPKTQIIFMTSFGEEAYGISEVPHTYFLVKSRLTDDMLKSAIQKSILKIHTQKSPDTTTVKSGNEYYTINYRDLVYVESMNNNIHLHFINGHNLTLYSSLTAFSERLPNEFHRCHKSFVVNIRYILKARPHEFILNDGSIIPISPKKYKTMLSVYQSYLNTEGEVC